MMPDWPSLWEREPALQPDGVMDRGSGMYLFCLGEDDGDVTGAINRVCDALCRDAATAFLAERECGVLKYGQGWMFFLNPRTGVSLGVTHATRDEALFAGCKLIVEGERRAT